MNSQAQEVKEEGLLRCPHCGGQGANQGIACGPQGCRTGALTCSTCKGSGRITPARQAKIEAGETMRRDRISRDLSQREEAKRRGIDVVIYSRMERGIHDEQEQSAALHPQQEQEGR